MHAKAAGLSPRLNVDRQSRRGRLVERRAQPARRRRGHQHAGELRQGRRRLRPRLARQRPARDQGRACRRGRGRGGGAADRTLDRGCRHRLRRLSVLRRARNRHAGQRRLSDDLLRRRAHRACHAACQRARSGGADHARAGRARDPRRRYRAQEAWHRAPKIFVGGLNPHAGEEGMFGSEEIEIIDPGDRARGAATASKSPARSAPTPCSAKKAATPSS